MELYRFLIEDFLINQCREYCKKDFIYKIENIRGQKGKRQYLNEVKTKDFMKELDQYFGKKVEIPRIYIGKRQTFETLINEGTLQFARYLRGELESWYPRIPTS